MGYIQDARVLNSSGREISFQLPLQRVDRFPDMLHQLDNILVSIHKDRSLAWRKVFIRMAFYALFWLHKSLIRIQASNNENTPFPPLIIRIPAIFFVDFVKLDFELFLFLFFFFFLIKGSQESYGLSITTLEEVFLRLANHDASNNTRFQCVFFFYSSFSSS